MTLPPRSLTQDRSCEQAHIFDMLGRLRQACDHPYLILHGTKKAGDKPLPSKTSKRPERAGALCGICQVRGFDLCLESERAGVWIPQLRKFRLRRAALARTW